MSALVPVFVAVLNGLGSILPQLPAFIAAVRSHPALDDNGKAAADAIGLRLADDEKAVDAVQPLPAPTPKA